MARTPHIAIDATVPPYIPAYAVLAILDRSDGGAHRDQTALIHGNVTPSKIPSTIRIIIKAVEPYVAAHGVKSVKTAVTKIPAPKTC